MDSRINSKQTRLLVAALFNQETGEGATLRQLFAATDADTATDEELRALYDALMVGLGQWLVRASFENWN